MQTENQHAKRKKNTSYIKTIPKTLAHYRVGKQVYDKLE